MLAIPGAMMRVRCVSVRVSVAPAGAVDSERLMVPPLKQWAIVGCPCQGKEQLRHQIALGVVWFLELHTWETTDLAADDQVHSTEGWALAYS
jgi:hypothetical protein